MLVAIVFYSPDAVKIKQLEEVTYEQIANAFNRKNLIIYTNPTEFKDYLFGLNLDNSALLLMSSGNYGGLNFDEVKRIIEYFKMGDQNCKSTSENKDFIALAAALDQSLWESYPS
jgi:hypothetical protein